MFKPEAVKRVVTATFQKPDGTPSEGSVTLKLDQPILGRQENTIYSRQGVDIELDETGSFERTLAVTNPGLTQEETVELENLQQETEDLIDELTAIQERINEYIQKMVDGDTITPTDRINYDNDQDRKREVQLELADLAVLNKEFEDQIRELEANSSMLTIFCNFKNPIDRSRIRLSIPPGIGPVDIADLPRE